MTYRELEVNTEIKLKEKGEGQRAPFRKIRYIVVAKYPNKDLGGKESCREC